MAGFLMAQTEVQSGLPACGLRGHFQCFGVRLADLTLVLVSDANGGDLQIGVVYDGVVVRLNDGNVLRAAPRGGRVHPDRTAPLKELGQFTGH